MAPPPQDASASHTSVPAQDDLQSLRHLTSHLATEAASSDPSSAKLLSLFESQNELRDREQRLQRQQEALWREQEKSFQTQQLEFMRQTLATQTAITQTRQKEDDEREAMRRADKLEQRLDRMRSSLVPMSSAEDAY